MSENSSMVDRRSFLATTASTSVALASSLGIRDGMARADEAQAVAPSLPKTVGVVAKNATPADLNGLRALLIFDRQSVAEADGVTFQLNPAKKHPENPVLLPGEPQQWDGLQVVWPGTVLYDAENKLFRCWYSGMDPVQDNRPPYWVPGYAESTDGVHWTKPELGQYTHNGAPTNRIAVPWSKKVLSLVTENPDQNDPSKHFLALWLADDSSGQHKILASSPDGKTWKKEGTAYRPENTEPFFDIYQLIFQPDAADENDRVVGYAQVFRPRSWDGHPVRHIGMVHGPHAGSLRPIGPRDEDFIVLAPEQGIDEEIHLASVHKVGGKFLMLFESDRFSSTPLHGDLRLAISDDGRKFRRVHPKTPLVATGPRGMWDENLLVVSTLAMQEVGDEIWIYYFGCPNVFTRWPGGYATTNEFRGSLFYPGYLGLATLPRDRFAFAAGPGSVTTPMLTIGEQGLWLNADGDGIIVSAISSSGATIAEGRVVESSSPGMYRQVQWPGGPPKEPSQVRIVLNAGQRLYSLRY